MISLINLDFVFQFIDFALQFCDGFGALFLVEFQFGKAGLDSLGKI